VTSAVYLPQPHLLTMPVSIEDEMKEKDHFLDDGDDSSDESESDSGDDSSDDESGDDSGSDSDDDSDDEDDDDDDSGSGSDSDDDDSDDDSESGSGSGSGSDSDDSSKKKKKKKKSKKDKTESKEEKEEDDDLGGSAIFKIQQISAKLSYVLDDLHRTFKPKSIPKIDPQSVFPYPYKSLPTDSPKKLWKSKSQEIEPEHDDMHSPQRHFATHSKSPISSPIRHGDHVDRGAGGNYIYPSYAAPPSQHEIKKLYKNYSDKERHKIAANQQRERERKFLSSRTGRTPRRSRRDITWEYETGNFSEEFITASNKRRNSPNHLDRSHRTNRSDRYMNENELDPTMPSTFDELYKHYDAERRLLEQKQNKMQRMRNKLYWFKKNNSERPLDREEKVPLKKIRHFKNTQSLNQSMNIKDREKNLLNKAAEVLLGNGSSTKQKTMNIEDEYDGINGMEVSPDSLQEKIMQIASEEDELVDDGHRLPTFV